MPVKSHDSGGYPVRGVIPQASISKHGEKKKRIKQITPNLTGAGLAALPLVRLLAFNLVKDRYHREGQPLEI